MNLNIFKRLADSEAEIASLRAEFKGSKIEIYDDIASVISLIDSKIADNNVLQYKRNARVRDYQPVDSPLTVLSVVNVPKPQKVVAKKIVAKKVVAKKAPRRTQKIMAAAARVTAKREYARLYYHRMKARKAAALQAAVATAGVAA